MNQPVEKDLFIKVIEAHNLIIEELDQRLIIKKNKAKNIILISYLMLSLGGIAIGILCWLTELAEVGKILTGISGSLLVVVLSLREREKDTEKKSIEIGDQKINIREGFKVRSVDFEGIAEFRTKVEPHENLCAGSISIITDNQMSYELIEIFGNNRDLLQEDLVIISDYIIGNYISNSD
ncbi:MAG: hypothetical protein ACK4TA_15455 [Saprospiraceae bacterium]